jgi:ParB-like chromosome segregation protein Spo0J
MSEPITPKATEPPTVDRPVPPSAIDLDTLTFHPLAEMFPLIGDEELKELAEDIRKHGLLEQITMFQDKVLDGRNRIRAVKSLGRNQLPRACFRDLKCDHDPRAYVISENIRRRHLSPDQRREVIEALLKADPSKSNRAIAATARVDHQTVAAARSSLETGGEIPHQKERVGKDGKKQKASKKGGSKKEAPHVAYNRKREELIDLLKETHTSFAQATEWVDNTKARLDETLAGIAEELDAENAAAA